MASRRACRPLLDPLRTAMVAVSFALVIVTMYACGFGPTSQSICDKGGINTVASAMGPTSIIVVVEPTSSPHNAKSSSGTKLKRVDVDVLRYLHGDGPDKITVSQVYNCGASRDSDYVDLKKDKQYALFLTKSSTGNWVPFAVPMGFAIDEQGNLYALHDSSRAYENPRQFGVSTVSDLASIIDSINRSRSTPLPTAP